MRMRKPPSFGRFLLTMVFLLEGLSLAIVISFLFAMLDRSMKQELISKTHVKQAELRLFITDRLNYTNTRVEEIRSNNNIRIGLLIEMHSKIAENLRTLYPPTRGSSFYVRTLDGQFFPPLNDHHRFIDDSTLLPSRSGEVTQTSVDPHTYAYFAPILQHDNILGHAVGVYDLHADPNCTKLLKAFDNLSLVYKTETQWVDLLSHRPLSGPAPKETEEASLSPDQLDLPGSSALQIGMKEFPSLFLNMDNRQYRQQRRAMVTRLVLLGIPIFLLTFAFSFLILKRVTNALDALAKNALHIADTGEHSNLDTSRVRHAEFLYLTKAFNKVMAKVREQTDDLKNTNKKLQQQIEERRQIALALQESESQLRSLQDNIPVGLFRKSTDGRLLFANPKMIAIFGYESEEEMIDVDFRQRFYYHQQYDHIMDKFETSDSIQNLELRFKRKDGTPMWGSVHLKISDDPKSGDRYIDGAIQDITDRKKIENENQKLETQLRQTHKMEALGTLAGGIAHDFNNILFAIIGFCELAIEDAVPESDQEKNLEEAVACIQRATELVRQILTFARQTDVVKQPLNLTPIMKENFRLLRATLPTTIDIRTMLKGDHTILADPTQVHQIIINLCTNASHAMRKKGGLLTIELEKVDIQPGGEELGPRLKHGAYARLRVKDSGHGMPPETIERIFDPYYTTKPQGEGTGMGLSVVQGIVNRLGGVIWVDSTLGKGTIFDIYLPTLEVIKTDKKHETKSVYGGKEHILFVDDEPPITRMISQTLSNLGYQLTPYNSPVEALKLFQSFPERFDLVISDVTMPQMTGYELTREILKIRPDLPVILCTGYDKSVNEESALDVGARALLYKPLTRQDLSATIRNVLNGSYKSTTIQQDDRNIEGYRAGAGKA
ncbi:MAG: ATP-binding protein [Desulfobacteraceae bacterium]